MDFLKEMKARLEELEEFSRQEGQGQHQAAPADLFRPKSEPQWRGRAQAEVGRGGGQARPGPQPPRGGQQSGRAGRSKQQGEQARGRQPEQVRRSRQPVDSDVCPVEDGRSQEPLVARAPEGGSVLDNLGERLDEAFLLQEVLGPPRCVREFEWD